MKGHLVHIKRLTLDFDAILPGQTMRAHGRWMLGVLVMLLAHFLELVFAVFVLIFLPVARDSVLTQAMQCSQCSLCLCAARLDILQHCLLYLVAHLEQSIP